MEYTDLYSYIYKDRVILLQVDLEIYIEVNIISIIGSSNIEEIDEYMVVYVY